MDETQEYKRLVLKFGEDAVRAIYGEEHSGQLAQKLQHTAKSTVKSKPSMSIASVVAE